MGVLKWLLVIAALAYGGVLALMYVFQRALMYFPDAARTSPAAAGLPEAEELMIPSGDGERLVAWHVPPRELKPVIFISTATPVRLISAPGDSNGWLPTGMASWRSLIAVMAGRPESQARRA